MTDHRDEQVRDLAAGIAAHDEDAVDQSPGELRAQWNVPEGRMPYIPLWLSLTFFGLLAAAILWGLFAR